MPSKSSAQARFMAMCRFAESPPESCPPRKVAAEFNQADRGTGILKGKKKSKKKEA